MSDRKIYVKRPKPVKAEVWLSPTKSPMPGVKRYGGAKMTCDECDSPMYLHGVFYAGQEKHCVCPGKYIATDEDDEMSIWNLPDFINEYELDPKP